jgi:AraC family transcriptional regulator of adaptative response/methylated-DNA-[protein]-cysteine methyltransferase
MYDYQRIANAIEYIKGHFREQPDLDAVAKSVYMSPFHFQRMFTEWAGVSPKKFLQFLTLDYAKELLAQKNSLGETAYETGLSGHRQTARSVCNH